MIVQRQQTPNPNALKFVLPELQFDRPLSFPSAQAASAHPLAANLFALGSIYNIFMVRDFVTVNKLPDVDWEPLATQAEKIIEEYLTQ
ncbi:NifU N-terminal domain-containing protein [Chloroflexi bacterium TSY]|nr:NifU N-terminal domain-containing protein [Chloroflexi bacterium TSY]